MRKEIKQYAIAVAFAPVMLTVVITCVVIDLVLRVKNR